MSVEISGPAAVGVLHSPCFFDVLEHGTAKKGHCTLFHVEKFKASQFQTAAIRASRRALLEEPEGFGSGS